jgi:hypothetical protein
MGSEEVEKNGTIFSDDYWDLVIEPRSSLFQVDIKEIWKFRDLLRMFVKREIVQFYKQTILGPLLVFHSAFTHNDCLYDCIRTNSQVIY